MTSNPNRSRYWQACKTAWCSTCDVTIWLPARAFFCWNATPLIAVLIDHRRLPFLPRIVEQLEKELDARMGFAEALISSARELGDAEKRALEAQVAKVTGKKVRAQYGLDPSLLGGAVVRIGSTIYDGSVVGQLEKIRERLSST